MNLEQIPDVQKWLPFEKILENGIIKLKDSSYIKILKVNPINYNLKSELEKQAILNSYKNFFKGFNSNIQLIIQSKKEDLNQNYKILKDNNNFKDLKEKYIDYINNLNKISKSSSKIFFLIIKEYPSDKSEEIIIKELQDNYFKVKDLLSRCGNFVSDYTKDNQILEILISFFNSN